MPTMPPTFRPHGSRPRTEANKEHDRRRGSARERGYDTAWDKAAKGHLAHSPLCVYCALEDRVAAATLVDHLYPHKGEQWLFWLRRFWCSCCKTCHDGFKQRIERAGSAALDQLARRLGLPTLAEVQATDGG